MKKFLATLLAALMFFQGVLPVCAEGESVEIESPSAILVEASTGTVLYEKAADEKRSPASLRMRQLRAPTQSLWEDLRFFWKRERSRR